MASTRTKRWLLGGAAGLVVVAALAGAILVWRSSRPPTPPAIDLADADPAVAAAVESARKEVLQAPRSPAAWGRLGMLLLANGFTAEAVPCLAEAERLAPREMRWPYYRAAALAPDDPDAAIAAYRRAVEVGGPAAVPPRLHLAELLLAQGHGDEAEERFNEVLQQEPDNPWARLGLARVACERGDWKASLPLLRRAAEGPATRRGANTLLAEVLQRLDDHKGAARAARQAAQLPPDPDPPDPLLDALGRLPAGRQTRLARASRLLKQERSAEAVELLREVVRDYPDSPSAWLGLGRGLLQQRHYAEARQALEEAARLAPDLVEGQFYLGVVLFQQGNPGEAARYFRRAAQLRPDHGLAWYNLGQCLKIAGDRPGAESALRSAVRYKPHYAPGRIELAELLAQAGRRAEALDQLAAALELAPDDPRARALRDRLHKQPAD